MRIGNLAARCAPAPAPSGLARDHEQLLHDVRRHTESVSAVLDSGTWPDAELRALSSYLRNAVLRHASDEEVLLFPRNAELVKPLADLTADHARLDTLTQDLDEVGRTRCAPADLQRRIDALLRLLSRHMGAEQTFLGSLLSTDHLGLGSSVAADPSGSAADAVAIDLDVFPGERAVTLCVQRLLRLHPQESAVVTCSDPLLVDRVGRWMRDFDTVHYGYTRKPTDSGRVALTITRRPDQTGSA